MLSRGGNRPGQRGRAPASFVGYGAIRGTAETGLTPVRLEEGGQITNDEAYGVQVEIGAYGTHSWRRTALGLDYRGDYRQTTRPGSGYNGTNQAISLDLTHTATRRTMLFLRETGGTTNRAFGGFAAPAVVDPNAVNVPNDEVFDTRTYFSQTTAGVLYRSSARMTYTFYGDGFFTKRTDRRLVGVSGYRAAAMAGYRFSSRSELAGTYQYMTFQFPRVYGDAEMHMAALTLSRRVTRNVDVTLSGGAIYLKSSGTQQVQLSPEVAALLGRSTGIEAFSRRFLVPQIATTLGYTLERSRFTAGYTSGVSPGNGVFLTSQRDALSVGYSFTGIRKLSLGASARYFRLQSRGMEMDDLNSWGGGGGFNYALTRILNLSSQVDYRTFRSGGIRGREGFYIAFGLSVSPSRIPISMW
jgi:hypothetical protein